MKEPQSDERVVSSDELCFLFKFKELARGSLPHVVYEPVSTLAQCIILGSFELLEYEVSVVRGVLDMLHAGFGLEDRHFELLRDGVERGIVAGRADQAYPLLPRYDY